MMIIKTKMEWYNVLDLLLNATTVGILIFNFIQAAHICTDDLTSSQKINAIYAKLTEKK